MAEVKYVGPTAYIVNRSQLQSFSCINVVIFLFRFLQDHTQCTPKQCQLPLTLMIVHTNCCPRQFLGPQPKQNNLSLSPWLLKKIKHFLTRYHQ